MHDLQSALPSAETDMGGEWSHCESPRLGLSQKISDRLSVLLTSLSAKPSSFPSGTVFQFSPGVETKSGNSENSRCVGSMGAPLLSLSLLDFLHLGSALLILWQSCSFQETGISEISPAGFWQLLLRVGVGVQEVVDTPSTRQHKDLSAFLFLGKKREEKGSPTSLGKENFGSSSREICSAQRCRITKYPELEMSHRTVINN